jgi:enamine deaminase RidA (YjgF/YER057c/UK114 family)
LKLADCREVRHGTHALHQSIDHVKADRVCACGRHHRSWTNDLHRRQLGIDADGKVAGALCEQIAQAFENVRQGLSSVGAGFKDIVKLNVYLVDIQANIGVFRAARDEILKLEQPPVSTAVGVPELARPGTLVEIEAVAVL